MSKKVTATILFVDIMNSMEIANYWNAQKYRDFLNEFQRLMQHGICLWKRGIKQIKFAGDEIIVFYSSKNIEDDIVNAIQLANTLKIMWYVSEPNRKRIKEGKKFLDLGIGINTGDVTYEFRPVVNELKKLISKRKTFEGLPISVAKRIESFSRKGRYSRIMVGQQIIAELNKTYHWYEYESMGLQRFKGMSQEIPVFELKSCYIPEAEIFEDSREFDWEIKQLEYVKTFEPSNIWLLMTLIDIYSHKKNYKKVEKFCREAIAVDNSVSNIHHELGEALKEQKKYDEALEHFDKAIFFRWDSWHSYIGKTECLILLGRQDECIKICKYAISNIPNWIAEIFKDALYYNIAAAYARKGNVNKALANIKKAVKIGGKDTLKYLMKDKDKDFCNLYENTEFKRLREGTRDKEDKKSHRK